MLKNNKAQVTVFVIVGILIFSAILIIFFLYDTQIREPEKRDAQEPTQSIAECVNDLVEKAIEDIIINSGYTEMPRLTTIFSYPEGYYKDPVLQEIPFLCYTARDYARCTPQEPLFIAHLEQEIYDSVQPLVNSCFQNLRTNLEEQGYEVTLGNRESLEVELIDGRARTIIVRNLRFGKTGEQKEFNRYETNLQTPLYSMGIITERIIEEEILICNSDFIQIMQANTNMEIERFQTGEGIKIYTIKDTSTKKSWSFALRNCILSTPS